MVKIRFETGQVVDFQGTPTQADIDEVAKSLQIQKPVEQPKESFIATREPNYKASVAGGVSDVPTNIAKTMANIPSSARNLTRDAIAPVNPLDAKSSMNIGANIANSAFAVKDIVANRGVFGGLKDIAGGVLDTAKKGVDIYKGVGQAIYNNLEGNVEKNRSVTGGIASSVGDVAIATSKKAIEDPLLIPSMIYAPSKVRGTGVTTDTISKFASPITRGADTSLLNVAKKSVSLPKNAIASRLSNPATQAKAIDQLEQTYIDLASGTTIGKKKVDKLVSKTQALDNAGTTGRTPMRTLAEEGIIPERAGTKLNTFDQASQYREKITPLREANKMALEEVGLSTAPVDLDALKLDAINYARTPSNINSGRFASMEKDIIKEFDLLKQYYPTGKVPLSIIDDIKSARWDNVFKNKSLIEADVLKKDSEYAIAKALQKRIEAIAEQAGNPEVAQLNRSIGDRLEAAKYLEDLNGKTIKGGRAMKYVTTAIGSSAGQSLPGKIVGALGGNLVGEMIIASNVANPIKRMILRNLRAKDPQAYTNTINWLKKQNLDRETRLLLPEASATYVSPNTQAPTSQMIVTSGKTPPATFAQAQKRASGLPEYGGLYEYNQAKEATQKAVGRSVLPKPNANKGTSVKRPPAVPSSARVEDLAQSKSPTSQQTKPAITRVNNISKSITVPKGSSIDATRKIVNNHLESTLMAISDTPTFDMIKANPQAFYRQQIQDIAMGLKAENPKYARLSNSIASIDASKINDFETLASKIREKLNQKTLMETITGKGLPNRQGGFIKNPLAENYKNLDWNKIPESGVTETIPLNKLKVDQNSFNTALKNVQKGDGSRTSGQIEVVMLKDGTYAIEDGHHRAVQKMLQGDKDIKATVYSSKDLYNENKYSTYNKVFENTTPLSQSDNLIQEAKKYKSAGDFVKAKLNGSEVTNLNVGDKVNYSGGDYEIFRVSNYRGEKIFEAKGNGRQVSIRQNELPKVKKVDSIPDEIPSYAMGHRPVRSGSGFDITDKGIMDKDVYSNPEKYFDMRSEGAKESFDVLKKIRNKPDLDVTIYRASPKNELNNGDWITLSKKSALEEAKLENTPVHSFRVKAKEIQIAGDDLREFGYFPKKEVLPKTKSQLEDIWKKANKSALPKGKK